MKRRSLKRWFLGAGIVVAALFGRPDLVLVFLVTAAAFWDFWFLGGWALTAVLLLKAEPAPEKDLLLLLAFTLGAFVAHKILPWRPLVNYCLILLGALFLWFFFSDQPVLGSGLILDLALAGALYFFMTFNILFFY